jgi:hypothetical protein
LGVVIWSVVCGVLSSTALSSGVLSSWVLSSRVLSSGLLSWEPLGISTNLAPTALYSYAAVSVYFHAYSLTFLLFSFGG